MTVADRIKEMREKRGWTQTQLAEKLGLRSGTSVTRIEKSGDDVTLKDVERIAEVFGCSPLELMGWLNPFATDDPTLKRLVHYFNMLNAENRNKGFDYIYMLNQTQGLIKNMEDDANVDRKD